MEDDKTLFTLLYFMFFLLTATVLSLVGCRSDNQDCTYSVDKQREINR